MKRLTLPELLGFGPRGAKAASEIATPPQPVQHRGTTARVDGRNLSADAYERRLRQLGLSAPGDDHRRMRPIDVEAQREANRDLDRVNRHEARERAIVDAQRATTLAADAIDGRSASAEDVRARLAQLGADAWTSAIALAPGGQPLAVRRDVEVTHGARMASAREVVQSAIALCKRTGQTLDTRKLDAFEVAAYRQIKGLDPS